MLWRHARVFYTFSFMVKLSNEPKCRRFAFCRWFEIRNDGAIYLRRLRVIETPWFGVYVHWIHRPDSDRWMHDHPFAFVSFMLRGWYFEETSSGERLVKWINAKRLGELHRITHVCSPPMAPALSLVFRGPRVRTWGFATDKGWVPWFVYLGVDGAASAKPKLE